MKIPALEGRAQPSATRTWHGAAPERQAQPAPSPATHTRAECVRVARKRRPKLPPGMILTRRYRITDCIGHGGMGDVYRARDLWLDRDVALKVLSKQRASTGNPAERFTREARTMAAVESPHLAPIYDLGVEGSCLFLVMRFVSAPPLSKILSARGALAPRRAARIICQVLEALQAIHAKGFVHRDIKPSNVLVDHRDHATLVDLGIVLDPAAAPITTKGTVLGTPAYMSPEQMEGQPLDHRSDLYSVGIVLMYALTGRLALRGHHNVLGEAMRARAYALPAPWAQVLQRALAPDPTARFPSAARMSEAIRGALDQAGADRVLRPQSGAGDRAPEHSTGQSSGKCRRPPRARPRTPLL